MKSFSDAEKVLTMQLTNKIPFFSSSWGASSDSQMRREAFFVTLLLDKVTERGNGMNSDDDEAYLMFPSPNKRPGSTRDLHVGQGNAMKCYINRNYFECTKELTNEKGILKQIKFPNSLFYRTFLSQFYLDCCRHGSACVCVYFFINSLSEI